MHSDFWSAYNHAAQLSEEFGGQYEIGYSSGRCTVQRMPLSDDALCPDYRKWRDALYLQFGVQ